MTKCEREIEDVAMVHLTNGRRLREKRSEYREKYQTDVCVSSLFGGIEKVSKT